MILNNILDVIKNFEDPKRPLLELNIKGLLTFGLLHHHNKYTRRFFKALHFFSLLFVISQFIDLYLMRNDFNKILLNLSMTTLSTVSISKTLSCLLLQSRLLKVIGAIIEEEQTALDLQKTFEIKLVKNYKKYARMVTLFYWLVTFITTVETITSPFIKYATTSSYRDEIKNGTEPYTQILSSWFPFDKTKMPGYFFATLIQIIMTMQGAGVIAVYDANAVVIMTFLKGQFIILQEKCRRIFGTKDEISTKSEIFMRIKECHRHHNFLLRVYSMFNSIISPVMYLYVLLCSINICCSVVQLNLDNVPTSQKLWVLEYALALSIQLFLFCWHSNEIKEEEDENENPKKNDQKWYDILVDYLTGTKESNTMLTYIYMNKEDENESDRADRGVYESNWWKADRSERKQLVLLAGKLARPYIMKAGPFTELSIPTFIDIMKGSYSFYTLFTHIQEKHQ